MNVAEEFPTMLPGLAETMQVLTDTIERPSTPDNIRRIVVEFIGAIAAVVLEVEELNITDEDANQAVLEDRLGRVSELYTQRLEVAGAINVLATDATVIWH